jgi:DNA polymerase (family 10)
VADLTNAQIAAAFDELADLYELDGAVQYRVIAYRNAARTVRESAVSVAALAREGKVTQLPNIGKTLEEKLRQALSEAEDGGPAPRVVLSRAVAVAEEIAGALREHPAADRVQVAGSLRRMADSVKDLDIIATASDPAALAKALTELPQVESVGSSGEAGARVMTHTGMKVDLRVVEPDQFGNVLQHFTGSKAHNVALREAAVRRGLHVSEYGILDDATGETLRCATEEEVYATLGLEWIPPELREGRGELEAATPGGGGLPVLITREDLRGDLHSHTTTSDGTLTAEQMVAAARERGLEYLAITDHSASHGFGDHVDADTLRARIDEIRALNERTEGFEVLIGTECNILPDGSLDYPDELLAQLDWVIASVHTSFQMETKAMTDRIVAAIEHPCVDALGHPTGRKIERRPPYGLDIERVIEAAVRTGTMIEINASPNRRDLNEIHARAAAEAGVRILVNSDAHAAAEFDHLPYGIATARRAWLTAAQVANTLPWSQFAGLRKRAAR